MRACAITTKPIETAFLDNLSNRGNETTKIIPPLAASPPPPLPPPKKKKFLGVVDSDLSLPEGDNGQPPKTVGQLKSRVHVGNKR